MKHVTLSHLSCMALLLAAGYASAAPGHAMPIRALTAGSVQCVRAPCPGQLPLPKPAPPCKGAHCNAPQRASPLQAAEAFYLAQVEPERAGRAAALFSPALMALASKPLCNRRGVSRSTGEPTLNSAAAPKGTRVISLTELESAPQRAVVQVCFAAEEGHVPAAPACSTVTLTRGSAGQLWAVDDIGDDTRPSVRKTLEALQQMRC